MKAIVFREYLHKALVVVGKIISTKTQLPILSNVLLRTEEGRLILSATNLETSTSFWIGGTIGEAGTITVPARLLSEVIASFGDEKVTLSTEKETLRLLCGKSEATLAGIDSKEFPPLPVAGEKRDAVLQREWLEKGLPFVQIASSIDEGRPLLTGIKFVEKKDSTTLVATDGYRLSVKQIPHVSGIEGGAVIPARVLGEVLRLAVEEKTNEIEIYLSKDKNQMLFLLPHAQIASRLIEGEYPTYEKIIPATCVTQVIFGKEELARAVKLASIYARESANVVRLRISGETATVSANTPQIGENKTTVSIKKEGEDGEIAFNARFLLDLLAVFPDEEIVLEMNGPLSPGMFKSVADDSLFHIIMPVRIQE